jgi:hypothetical protein
LSSSSTAGASVGVVVAVEVLLVGQGGAFEKISLSKLLGRDVSAVQVSTAQVSTAQISTAQVSIAQVGTEQDGLAQVGPAQDSVA